MITRFIFALAFMFFISFMSFLNGSNLNFIISSNPSRINPILATDSSSSLISDYIFNALVKYDNNLSIIGDLAKRFYFKDSKTLIFELRDDVLFSNGDKFSADDVIFTYETAISKKIFSPYSSSFKYVKYLKKIDNLTIEVKYTRAYFKALEIWMMGILPKSVYEKEDNLMTSQLNKNPIGSDAYTLKTLSASSNIILRKNNKYFEKSPIIDTITYHFIPDSSTSFLMLKNKLMDLGSLTPLQLEKEIDDDFLNFYKIITSNSLSYTYLGFNLKKPPFNNPKIREAISLAINKQEIIDILFLKKARVSHGPFLPESFGFNKDVVQPYNITRAKKILKSLGFDKKNPLSFEISTSVGNSTRLYLAEIIRYQLSFIGIKVRIKSMEWQAFLNTVVHPRNFEAIILGWALPFTPDAYNLWHSESDKKGGFNFIGYKNQKVDDLIIKAQSTIDKKKLSKIYQIIYKEISQDNPYVFLYIPNSILAVNKNIKHIKPSILGVRHNIIEWEK